MIKQQITWVGLTVEDFLIEELIGEGSFSWVYRGTNFNKNKSCVFKVAKPPELMGSGGSTGVLHTEALGLITDAVIDICPDPYKLLASQGSKLQAVSDPELVVVEEIAQQESSCYLRMELIEGRTLREIMRDGPVPVQALIDLAQAMERLSRTREFEYHGDLKPENILVTAAGIKLIDPGLFGVLELDDGTQLTCAVTTPAYYPVLEPDDLFAFGLMLWEAALGEQPLRYKSCSERLDRRRASQELLQLVRSQEVMGKYFLSSILALKRPSEIRPGTTPELERLLVKALRLKFKADGTLDLDSGFRSFGALAGALLGLLSAGIRTLG